MYKHGTYSKITRLNAPTLKIRRASRWGYFNATPERVKKGKSITIRGRLERAD